MVCQRQLALSLVGLLLALMLGGIHPLPSGWASETDNSGESVPPTATVASTPEEGTEESTSPETTIPLPYPEPDGVPLPEEEEEPASAPDTTAPDSDTDAAAEPNDLETLPNPEEKLLIQADRLYQAGDIEAATTLYRQVKDPLWHPQATQSAPAAILDAADLPPAGAVYWREAQAGAELGLDTRLRIPLELLLENYPEFIPAYGLQAEYLLQQGQVDEALNLLEGVLQRYPNQPDLLQAKIDLLMAQEQWLAASITARQFALLNPDHPDRGAMETLAEENLERFKRAMNAQLRENLFTNIITGAAGYFLTGGLLGPFTAVNSSILMLQGEESVGAQVAEQAKQQLPLMEDPQVLQYVDRIGQTLARRTGRDDFDYDFYVVLDDSLNAFALPGGKIFINAGAILKTNSEAELAGLLAHEISHAVLSHGFQMVTRGNLTTSLAAFIPSAQLANIAANLVVADYSRDMERQADILGTQILATSDYAADGLYNLMVTLRQENGGGAGIRWFASHPATDERVQYLQQLVQQGGYDRYAFEGVLTHRPIQQRVATRLEEYEAEQAERQQRRQR
ncbi:peptidase M48 [Halomicronema hongdechloris C2206]|uniref:Peptidase M48 n=1 Tax=Halomicronema hongdechloris C2206 TaxID=1641165 RepID=A0A1Z3HLT1_9CYAN|nr:M48 family metallopeptidase [Halomicronema hongdechloris]ASC71272.1 peptidase M48 [Halomicronema hongdechloris C2206]